MKWGKIVGVVEKVRAILIKDGKISITKVSKSGAFMLPGGKVEEFEDKEDALKREIIEENGIDIYSEDIKGSFYETTRDALVTGDDGKNYIKTIHTTFYLVETNHDFDYGRIDFSPREIARGTAVFWINPSILEFYLTQQRDKAKSEHARRYAIEFLNVYAKFKEYRSKDDQFTR